MSPFRPPENLEQIRSVSEAVCIIFTNVRASWSIIATMGSSRCRRYISSIKQSAAGGAIASVQATMFVSAGVLILVSSIAVQAIGMGPFFTIMAGLQALSTAYAFGVIFFKRRASHARRHGSTANLTDLTSHLA